MRKLYHESKKPILVIFSSPSCGPCHVLKPQLKRVIKELDGAVLGVEIDIDKDQDIAKQAGINGTPTVQLFKEKLSKVTIYLLFLLGLFLLVVGLAPPAFLSL